MNAVHHERPVWRALLRRAAAPIALATCLSAQAMPVGGTSTEVAFIPDNDPAGVSTTIGIAAAGYIRSMQVVVAVNHMWLGDLKVTLSHGPMTIRLMDQPGIPTPADAVLSGAPTNLTARAPLIFSAQGLAAAETMGQGCRGEETVGESPGCKNTWFTPEDSFDRFLNYNVTGDWVLNVSDNLFIDEGTFTWAIKFDVSERSVNEPASLGLLGIAVLGLFAFPGDKSSRAV